MKKILLNKNIFLCFRVILSIVFIYASYDKIINPIAFSDTIDNYHITPIILNNIFALVIPWLELVIGLCLFLNVFFDDQ